MWLACQASSASYAVRPRREEGIDPPPPRRGWLAGKPDRVRGPVVGHWTPCDQGRGRRRRACLSGTGRTGALRMSTGTGQTRAGRGTPWARKKEGRRAGREGAGAGEATWSGGVRRRSAKRSGRLRQVGPGASACLERHPDDVAVLARPVSRPTVKTTPGKEIVPCALSTVTQP